VPTLQVIVGPYGFQEHAPLLWREGLAADPIFMDVAAEILQGSDSCLLMESMESPFNLFSRDVRNKLLYELVGAAVISIRILES